MWFYRNGSRGYDRYGVERRVGEIFEGVDTSRLSVTCILATLFCFFFFFLVNWMLVLVKTGDR